jgi:hypothetical protein
MLSNLCLLGTAVLSHAALLSCELRLNLQEHILSPPLLVAPLLSVPFHTLGRHLVPRELKGKIVGVECRRCSCCGVQAHDLTAGLRTLPAPNFVDVRPQAPQTRCRRDLAFSKLASYSTLPEKPCRKFL